MQRQTKSAYKCLTVVKCNWNDNNQHVVIYGVDKSTILIHRVDGMNIDHQ